MNRRCNTPDEEDRKNYMKKRTASCQIYFTHQEESIDEVLAKLAVVTKEANGLKNQRDNLELCRNELSEKFKVLREKEKEIQKISKKIAIRTETIKEKYQIIKNRKEKVEKALSTAKTSKESFEEYLKKSKLIEEKRFSEIENEEALLIKWENEISIVEAELQKKNENFLKLKEDCKSNQDLIHHSEEREKLAKSLLLCKAKLLNQEKIKSIKLKGLEKQADSLINYYEHLIHEISAVSETKMEAIELLQKIEQSKCQLKTLWESIQLKKESIQQAHKHLNDINQAKLDLEAEMNILKNDTEFINSVNSRKEMNKISLNKINKQNELQEYLDNQEKEIPIKKEKNLKLQAYLDEIEIRIKLNEEISILRRDVLEQIEKRQTNIELYKVYNKKKKEREVNMLQSMIKITSVKEKEIMRRESFHRSSK